MKGHLMTKIYYDTEFLEDGCTIDLISIGLVAEDGREYYAVNADMDVLQVSSHSWLNANVWPHLPLDNSGFLDRDDPAVKRHHVIAAEVQDFICSTYEPELWAWYGAYDHVALCQLWGPMVDLPVGVPMFTNDLKQEATRLRNPDMPEQASGVHNALADARHNKVMGEFLTSLADA